MRNKKGNVLAVFLASSLILASVAVAFFFFSRSRQDFGQVLGPYTPTASESATPTSDETVNWEKYTDIETGLSIQFPPRFTFSPDKFAVDNSIDFSGTSKSDSIHIGHYDFSGNLNDFIEKMTQDNPGSIGPYSAEASASQNIIVGGEPAKRFNATYGGFVIVFVHKATGYIFYTGVTNNNEINQILSTIKFTDIQSLEQSPEDIYIVPETWKKETLATGLTLCLPQKWEIDKTYGGEIYFNRDPGYRPQVTSIQNIPYSGGLRQKAYFDFWRGEYPNVEKLVSVTEVPINNSTVLKITPNNSADTKSAPEGLAVVWFANNKLWKAGLSSWNMINTSQSTFLKDFYTVISCSL